MLYEGFEINVNLPFRKIARNITEIMLVITIYSPLWACWCFLVPAGSTAEVLSINMFPVTNLGGDELLSCSLRRKSDVSILSSVSVTWEKTGLKGFVYQYVDGAPNFSGQSPEFEGRTQLFPDVLVRGNASLLLRSVRRSDGGVYTCSIDSSDGGGKVSIQLRTAGG